MNIDLKISRIRRLFCRVSEPQPALYYRQVGVAYQTQSKLEGVAIFF